MQLTISAAAGLGMRTSSTPSVMLAWILTLFVGSYTFVHRGYWPYVPSDSLSP